MDTTVWLRGAFSGKAVPLRVRCGALGRDLLPPRDQGYPLDSLYVKCNGRLVGVDEELQNGLVYSLEPRLCGGKGGFGSMLRALGAQIEKTTNREACRDLSGRRLRDVNHENAMADWVKQQAEREAEKEQRRLERLQRKLAEPKHYFTNLEYQKQCSEMAERLEDSVLKGMQASSSSMVLPEASNSRKRPTVSETKPPSLKKKCFWTGLEGVEDSGSSDGGESDGENLPSASGVSAEYKRSPADCMGGDTSGESSSEESEAYDLPSTTLESTLDHHVGNLRGGFVGDLVKTQSQSPDAQLENNTVDQETAAAVETAEEVTDKICRSKEIKRCDLSTESAEKAPEQIGDFGNGLHCPIMTVEGSSPSELNGVGRSAYDERPTEEEERIQEKEVLAEDGICPPILSQADLPVDLMTFASAPELECLGLETLKQELITRGLKCGGTLQERAARLFSVKGLTREQIDPTLFAKPSKGKKK